MPTQNLGKLAPRLGTCDKCMILMILSQFSLSCFLSFRASDDGNCLYNAVSISLIGNEKLTSIELFENASCYAKQPYFVEIQKNEESGFYSKDSPFNLSLSDIPSGLFKLKNRNKRTKEQFLEGETTDNGKEEDQGNHEQCVNPIHAGGRGESASHKVFPP